MSAALLKVQYSNMNTEQALILKSRTYCLNISWDNRLHYNTLQTSDMYYLTFKCIFLNNVNLVSMSVSRLLTLNCETFRLFWQLQRTWIMSKALQCTPSTDESMRVVDLRSVGRQSDRLMNKILTLINKTIHDEHAYEQEKMLQRLCKTYLREWRIHNEALPLQAGT